MGGHFRNTYGIFVVTPAYGVIYPSSQTTITVECLAEFHSGHYKEVSIVIAGWYSVFCRTLSDHWRIGYNYILVWNV